MQLSRYRVKMANGEARQRAFEPGHPFFALLSKFNLALDKCRYARTVALSTEAAALSARLFGEKSMCFASLLQLMSFSLATYACPGVGGLLSVTAHLQYEEIKALQNQAFSGLEELPLSQRRQRIDEGTAMYRTAWRTVGP